MNLSLSRETLLKALQKVIGVVEKRQTMPILGNVLLQVQNNTLTLTASDLEIETRVETELESSDGDFATSLPAIKLITIIRSLSEGLTVVLSFEEERCTLTAGRSRFKLSTLPAEDFPIIDMSQIVLTFSVSQHQLKTLIHNTAFAMATQDVRFYLNGMLFEIQNNQLRVVATDGHRLSTCVTQLSVEDLPTSQAILPRKGVLELQKLIQDQDSFIELALAQNYLTIRMENTTFTCKLIDGRFPDYRRVIPTHNDQILRTQKTLLKGLLQRAAILSNDKFKGVKLVLTENLLTVYAHNTEQDESQEDMTVDYTGLNMEIGFNVNYLLDVISAIPEEDIALKFENANTSCLIESDSSDCQCQHVIMPMRL